MHTRGHTRTTRIYVVNYKEADAVRAGTDAVRAGTHAQTERRELRLYAT